MTEIDRWKHFWGNQITPLHRFNTPFWYEKYAEEINLILKVSEYSGGAVLETGCGNGALFPYLEINKKEYTGVDISESLLGIFRNNHPGTNLLCEDSSTYRSNRHFSLILSNGVIQYFNRQMMHRYILNSMEMLEENGILLIANILWKDVKNGYYSGELTSRTSKTGNLTIKIIKSMIWRIIKPNDSMGHFYNPRDFFQYKANATVFGSLFHPYRFSVVLQKKSTNV